jgi:hypothetical protein
MPVTRGFRKRVEAHPARDPAFRAGFDRKPVQASPDGNFSAAKIYSATASTPPPVPPRSTALYHTSIRAF